jgi:hypothetical protein
MARVERGVDATRGASIALFSVVLAAALAAQLEPSLAQAARRLSLAGAFWAAILEYLGRGGAVETGLRFVAGLAAAGLLTHLGWALLYLDAVLSHPALLADPFVGQSVLFAPLGILLLAPGRSSARSRYLSAGLGSLPLGFAVARLGCMAAGCCHGIAGAHALDPAPLGDIAGLLALGALTRRLPDALVGPATLSGFGALRLALEPLRAPPPLGPPVVAPSVLAIGWILIGSALGVAARRGTVARVGTT